MLRRETLSLIHVTRPLGSTCPSALTGLGKPPGSIPEDGVTKKVDPWLVKSVWDYGGGPPLCWPGSVPNSQQTKLGNFTNLYSSSEKSLETQDMKAFLGEEEKVESFCESPDCLQKVCD